MPTLFHTSELTPVGIPAVLVLMAVGVAGDLRRQRSSQPNQSHKCFVCHSAGAFELSSALSPPSPCLEVVANARSFLDPCSVQQGTTLADIGVPAVLL